MPSTKEMLLATIADELPRTRRLLAAYPAAQSEMKPHPTSNSARQLAHTLCVEANVATLAAKGTLDATKLGGFPPAPATWAEVMSAFDGAYAGLADALKQTSDATLEKPVIWLIGPKQVGPVPAMQVVQFMLHDHIHHRGQLSVYLRMTGSKVPSIYGPSKDEPWN